MLPMPTVADSAVVSAWKCETSPGSSGSSYLPDVMAKPCPEPANLDEAQIEGQIQAGANEGDHDERQSFLADRESGFPNPAVEPGNEAFESLQNRASDVANEVLCRAWRWRLL